MTHPSRRRGALLAGLAALSLTVLVGCSGAGDEPVVPAPGDSAPAGSPPATSTAPSPATEPSPAADPSPGESATEDGGTADAGAGSTALLAAGETALEGITDGVVVSVDPERRDTVWEVDVVTPDGGEQQLVVAADGSEVTSGPVEERLDAEDRAENQRLTEAAVDYRQAVETAESEVGGSVTQLSLDSDDGRVVWEVDVDGPDGRRDLVLDADDGTVLQDEAED